MTIATSHHKKKPAPMEFIGDMGRMFKNDLSTVYNETTTQERGNKIKTALWGALITGYTVADDVPMGMFYSLVDRSAGTPSAIGAVTALSTGIAGGLAMKQRRRKIRRIEERGQEPVIENGSLLKDSINVYGVGVPATVLSYPRESVPTRRRTALLALFYGGVGQGLSYAGFETAGGAIGVHPKVALALGILGAGSYRYGSAVRQERSAGTNDGPLEITNIDEVIATIQDDQSGYSKDEVI